MSLDVFEVRVFLKCGRSNLITLCLSSMFSLLLYLYFEQGHQYWYLPEELWGDFHVGIVFILSDTKSRAVPLGDLYTHTMYAVFFPVLRLTVWISHIISPVFVVFQTVFTSFSRFSSVVDGHSAYSHGNPPTGLYPVRLVFNNLSSLCQ